MSGMPNTSGPHTHVNAVIARMALLYRSPNVSSNRETAGRRFCAAAVRRAMRAGVESSDFRVVRTTSAPSLFTAPAGTSSPTRFETGSASPVMCWMETNALPCSTTPSRGTCAREKAGVEETRSREKESGDDWFRVSTKTSREETFEEMRRLRKKRVE